MGNEPDNRFSNIPPGWHALLRQLADDLAELDPDLAIDDAKQKFGELRVHLNRSASDAHELVDAVTEASRAICKQCGAAARLSKNRHGWYRTLCAEHSAGFVPAIGAPLVASVRLFLRHRDGS